jgi:hypothetical protein
LLVAAQALSVVPAEAQSRRLGVIGIGAFGRVGSLPPAFDQGVPLALQIAVQWPVAGSLQLATSADLTIQRVGTQTAFAGAGVNGTARIVRRPYSFDVVHFGAGPAFSVEPGSRVRVSGSIQAMAMVPSWNSASVGSCVDSCAALGPPGRSQQAEFHMGAAARVRVMYGARKERLGLEVLAIAGPRHTRSRIPLSTVALLLVVGAS